MPKIRFDTKPSQYNKAVSAVNCNKLISDIRLLVDEYSDMLSLDDKKQLLYIARTILAHNKKLPYAKQYGYNLCINNMFQKCRTK